MQKEFEKNVQQKMQDLKMVPSVPVWRNIDYELRRRKDRRRIIFWLPLFVLILGAASWWFIIELRKKDPVAHIEAPGNSQYAGIKGNKTNEKNENKLKKASEKKPIVSSDDIQKLTRMKDRIRFHEYPQQISGGTVKKPLFKNTGGVKNEMNSEKFQGSYLPGYDQSSEEEMNGITMYHSVVIENENILIQKNKSLQLPPVIQRNFLHEIIEGCENLNTSGDKTAKPVHTNSSRLRFAITSGTGLSGISNGLSFFSAAKSMNASPAFAGQPAIAQPAKPKNALLFNFEFQIIKKLNRKFIFMTGINYNYFSNVIRVGQLVNQNPLLVSSPSFGMNQFYINPANGTGQNNTTDFKNNYHFIGLPLNVSVSFFHDRSVTAYGGFQIQHLLSSDGLIYDNNTNVYYHNMNAFNRNQIFTGFGVTYSFRKSKHQIEIGPHVEYGINSLDITDQGNHLYSFGLSGIFHFRNNNTQ